MPSSESSDDLVNSISSGSRKAKRIKPSTKDSDIDDLETYRNAGRMASSLLDTFGVPAAAFKTGIQADRGGKPDSKLSEDDIARHLLLYNGIIGFIPGFEEELDNISSKKLNMIIAMVAKGMSDGRSADLNSVKHKGMQYIPLNMYSKADALDPPIPEVEDKSMRGLNHPQLARLLCPRKRLDWFDEDPESAMAALQGGEVSMTARNWPTLFYEDGIYDPTEKTKGLFKNHIVVRFYKHLFIGPSSVTSDSSNVRNSAKPSKNRAWGLTAVNKYIIAYIHIITYFTLSSAQYWMRYIGDMDLEELLLSIVEVLDDDDAWVKETLAWWNRQLKPTQGNSTKLMRKESEDDVAQIRAQRAAHRSALSAPTSNGHVHSSGTDHRHDDHSSHLQPSMRKRPARIMSDEEEVQAPPPKRPRIDQTRRLPPPQSRHQQPDHESEDYGAPPPKFKRQRAHTNYDEDEREGRSPAPKSSRTPVVYTLDTDEDEHDRTPVPKISRRRFLPYNEDDDDREAIPVAPAHKRRSVSVNEEDEEEDLATRPKPKPRRPTAQERHPVSVNDNDEEDLAPRPKPKPRRPTVQEQRPVSINDNDEEDLAPRPKPKPKPKPRRPPVHSDHDDSAAPESNGRRDGPQQSLAAPPSRHLTSPLSDLTDEDAPVLASKQLSTTDETAPAPPKAKKGGKRAAKPKIDAPRRTSGRKKANGY